MSQITNSLPLQAIKPSLDAALAAVSAGIEQYFSSPDAGRDGLARATAELRRVNGVLRMFGLDGLAVFCAELERLLLDIMDGTAPTQDLQREAARRALMAVARYLSNLLSGAENVALKLYPRYLGMRQARGVETAAESDLFFPNLAVAMPETGDAPVPHLAMPEAVRSLRSKYQYALLKWLRHDNPHQALETMRDTVRQVMGGVPQDQRLFWWVSEGLLDCLLMEGLPPELNPKRMLGRMDLQMKSLVEGASPDVRNVLSEMLYLIARSHEVNETVAAIKQAFKLEKYLPGLELDELEEDRSEQVLDEMRTVFKLAESSWEHCVLGDAAACGDFAGQSSRLSDLSSRLERDALHYLCEQIRFLTVSAEPEQLERVSLDMAMALLLLHGGIEHYNHLDPTFRDQARALMQRIETGLRNEPPAPDLDSVVEVQCHAEEKSAIPSLAGEMLNNLDLVEQSLNAYFEDIGRISELPQVAHWLVQVRGALHMLSLPRAVQVLDMLKSALVRLQDEKRLPEAAEMSALAFALGALQSVAQNLVNGQRHDEQLTEAAMSEMAALHLRTEQSAAQPETQDTISASVAETRRMGITERAESQELLEIFLEEAREVLSTIVENLETSFLHHDSREPLTVIRRGFHTLKGSGRMVGLKELGEVAWAVERVMNGWLQDEKAATMRLLAFIRQAEAMFRQWVEELSAQGNTEIAAEQLLEEAGRLERGEEEAQSLQVETESTQQMVVAAESAEVAIGAVTMSPTMFAIATEEAVQHVQSLRSHLTALQETEPSIVHYDFMRAAHTLAGIHRTLGFLQVAELAFALEVWLQQRIDTPLALSDAQLELLARSIDALDGMVQMICRKQSPEGRADLVAALHAEPLQPVSVPDVEEKVTELAVPVQQVVDAPAEETPEAEAAVDAPAAALADVPLSQPATPQVADYRLPEEIVHNIRDDVDEQLLPVFLEESNDLYPQIGANLRAWRENPSEEALARSLRRTLHTLKGGARMAGAMRAGELTHRMEDSVIRYTPAELAGTVFWDNLDSQFDFLGGLLEQLRRGETANELDDKQSEDQTFLPQQLEIGAERAILSNVLRVRSDVVDRLVNEAGEIGVTRSHIETEMRAFKTGLLELTDSVNRLRNQLREIEIQAESQMQARLSLSQDTAEKFDPLEFDRFTRLQELTRFMNESVHDVQTVQQNLLKNLDETAGALSAQSHLSRELQQGLMSIRMVPFASISERLYRIVRQTGKELGKKANLELRGTELELDRSMLEKMTAPFEHLLRNALVHGLESPEMRAEQGKPPIGDVRLSLRHENNEIVFEFSDDGAGLDLQKLREKGIELGLLQTGEEVSDDQIIQLIFASGLTTAEVVTEIAGRGVGMDVVRSEISALGGLVSVSTEVGKGTSFVIHLPLTLAVMQTLMVHAGETVYAIPSTMVEQVQQYRQADLEKIALQRNISWQGRTYPLHYLPHLLGDDERVPEIRPHTPILLLRSGDLRIALQIDEMAGNQEVVVKNIGPQLARMRGIAGATVLGNGQVSLILNPPQLAQRIAPTRKVARSVVVEPQRTQPLVMVVDDSLTVRKITSRLLSRSGYQVVTAKDGVDALEQLAGIVPQVILLDIEMPRMDGFELTKQLRRDPAKQKLPIIMITSRTAEKHREHALQLGVNEYLGKPYQEEELLRLVAEYVAVSR